MYRPREWWKVERVKERSDRRTDWFKGPKRKAETVIFVPTTPGGELGKRNKETIERAKVKVAVTEHKKYTTRVRPTERQGVRRPTELHGMCKRGRGCRYNGVTYKVKCKE